MIRVTAEDRQQARDYIERGLALQVAYGSEPTAPTAVIERSIEKVARSTAELRAVTEARKARAA